MVHCLNVSRNKKTTTKKTEMLKQNVKKSRVAPFRNKDEFQQVYQLLFPSEQNREFQIKAYEMLQVWKLRRGAETSASILSTLAILEAQIRDTGKSAESSSVYAGAFTRFLNYVSSIEQKQKKRSMYSIANQLGIESSLVDLRHLCSHGQNTPSLDVFRRSATYCMSWLREFYWDRELKHIQDTNVNEIKSFNTTRFERNLRRMANIYDAVSQGIHSGCSTINEVYVLIQDERQPLLQEYVAQLNEINLRKIFNCILTDLIMASRSRIVKENAHIFCEQLLSSPYFIESSSSGDNRIINLHGRLISEMQKCGYLAELFYVAVHISEDSCETNSKRLCAAFWADKILEAIFRCRDNLKADSDNVIILNEHIELDLSEDFIATRIKNASYFTSRFLKRIFSMVTELTKDDKYAKFVGLLNVSIPNEDEKDTKGTKRKIYTVDDLTSLMPTTKKSTTVDGPHKIWKELEEIDDIDWKKIPLGTLIEKKGNESSIATED